MSYSYIVTENSKPVFGAPRRYELTWYLKQRPDKASLIKTGDMFVYRACGDKVTDISKEYLEDKNAT